MRISRSRRICLSCNRLLPMAAARCPWCIASVVVPAALANQSVPHRQPTGHLPARRVLL